jgi:DNA invertase Pin-like site-specific DNA recombinase
MTTVEMPRATSLTAGRCREVGPLALSRSVKITSAHLAEIPIVYVRQSSPQQVLKNRESTERQYNFAEQAVAFGWPRDRVLTIDEDLGKSGRTAEGRTGFQRLVEEVKLGHVGMVLGLELSRLARSSKDWHAFFEMCAVFGTLIADEDGVYDANDPNDRLVLGMKGIMSEMELHVMRNRLDHGRRNKARRGELFYSVPRGYVLAPTGKPEFDPDEQARSVMHLVFEKFDELGSAHGLFFWLVKHAIHLPIRPRTGPNKGNLEWRRPSEPSLLQLLHNPFYAGAYAHGRRPLDSKRRYVAGTPRAAKWLPMDQWEVLIRDHVPAYITWEKFLRNQERLKQNQTRQDTPGAPRKGCALLPGLLVCGRCGWRMQVGYRSKNHPHYRCMHDHSTATKTACFGLAANELDDLVSGQVLRALEPAGLELSVKAQADLGRERERLNKHWKQQIQRSRYDRELAERRYQAVDPDNRLVAATLERRWEESLRQERQLQEDYERHTQETLSQLSAEDEARIASLASDIPALWHSPQTTNMDRQAIIRCLVERVVVDVERNSEHTEVTIHWAGGYESRHEFVRPVRTYEQLSFGDRLMKRIVELREAGKTAAQTAEVLNREGFKPINPRDIFNGDVVEDLLLKLGLRTERYDDSLLAPGEWWVRNLAKELGMPWQTLREWATNGWAHGRQTNVEKLWIMWADDDEVRRLRKLRSAQHRGILGYPVELTTPKRRIGCPRS